MQIISNVALISINETLFVQLISFLIFLFVINRVMFKPLNASMNEREAYMDSIVGEVKTKKQEITDILDQLNKQEATVISEAHALKSALEEEGEREANEINAEIQKAIAEIRRKTESEVDAQIADARKFIEKESEKLAIGIMEKVLDRRLAG